MGQLIVISSLCDFKGVLVNGSLWLGFHGIARVGGGSIVVLGKSFCGDLNHIIWNDI